MNCKNCGHPSHCGGPKYARDLHIKIEGMPSLARICDHCSCEFCETRTMTIKEYIEQHKKHEENRVSTVERNAFWKKVKIKD